MKLYFVPLSSYSQKALIALYEKGIPFTPEMLDFQNPDARGEYSKVNPLGKVPTLVADDGELVFESSIIVEYLEERFPDAGTRLIPDDKALARKARLYDRLFDFYINDQMYKIFSNGMKPEAERDPSGVAAAKAMLDKAYAMFDQHFASRTWAVGDAFTLADCSAAPALSYAKMLRPFDQYKNLTAYMGRLAERPSFARVQADAAPFLAKLMGALNPV